MSRLGALAGAPFKVRLESQIPGQIAVTCGLRSFTVLRPVSYRACGLFLTKELLAISQLTIGFFTSASPPPSENVDGPIEFGHTPCFTFEPAIVGVRDLFSGRH